MKLKVILIFFVIINNAYIISASDKNDTFSNDIIKDKDIIDIRIAIYTDEEENEDFYLPGKITRFFIYSLRDYQWIVGEKLYRFIPTLLSTENILKGKLTTHNFDILIISASQAVERMNIAYFKSLPRNVLLKIRINKFIEDGGGYFGSCGGATMIASWPDKPKTFAESLWKNTCLGISRVEIYHPIALPLVYKWAGHCPDSMGVNTYNFYSGWNLTDYENNHYGVCLDFPIFKNHPIFDDYHEDTRRIRWSSGPGLIIQNKTDREISTLINYPEEEISENETMKIYHWIYTGRISGFFKGILDRKDDIHNFKNFSILMKLLLFAYDWKKTEHIVETNLSNKAFMTTEIYPNENKARLVLCSGHPELNVWWGGYIQEREDTKNNNMFEGFHRWVDVIPSNETIEDENSYNFWIVRRSVAWVSQKVPNNSLPPVYGSSQVSDINRNLSEFTIYCIVEPSKDITSIDLYYRYSNDEKNWSDWKIYDIDNTSSNGWSWNFNASKANGQGFYQFYSIMHKKYGDIETIEIAPPEPDATAHINNQ